MAQSAPARTKINTKVTQPGPRTVLTAPGWAARARPHAERPPRAGRPAARPASLAAR